MWEPRIVGMLQYQESPALNRVNLNYGSSLPTYTVITDDSVTPPRGLGPGPRQSVALQLRKLSLLLTILLLVRTLALLVVWLRYTTKYGDAGGH